MPAIDLSEYSPGLLDYVATTYGPDLQPVQVAVFAELTLILGHLGALKTGFAERNRGWKAMNEDLAKLLATVNNGGTDGLYDTDFVQWSFQQAALLKAGRLDTLDMDNLIEEIEAIGRGERRDLGIQIRRILLNLLVDGSNPSLEASINDARNTMDSILEDSPSLVRELPGIVAKEYLRAKRQAIRETRKPASLFPDTCPYSLEQIQNFDWLPT